MFLDIKREWLKCDEFFIYLFIYFLVGRVNKILKWVDNQWGGGGGLLRNGVFFQIMLLTPKCALS